MTNKRKKKSKATQRNKKINRKNLNEKYKKCNREENKKYNQINKLSVKINFN